MHMLTDVTKLIFFKFLLNLNCSKQWYSMEAALEMLKGKGFRPWTVCLPVLLKQGVLVWHSKLLECKCDLEILDMFLLVVTDATIMNVWQVLIENHPTSSKKW